MTDLRKMLAKLDRVRRLVAEIPPDDIDYQQESKEIWLLLDEIREELERLI